jgi:glycerol uptake facilitator-like aquaporin
MYHKKLLFELLGTMLLSFAALKTSNWLILSAVFAGLVSLVSPRSGGPFNPAIVAALLVSNRISQMNAAKYIVVEIIGGILGYVAYKLTKKITIF